MYIAYLEQLGEGCDYTIGCGRRIELLESNNDADVLKELKELILENYNNDETKLEKISLYKIEKEIEISVEGWYQEYDDLENKIKKEEQEKEEKKLLEQLKNKYEK